MNIFRTRADSGPIGKLLTALATVVVLVLAFMFSMLILAFVAVAGVIGWSYFWWKTRKLRETMPERPPDGVVIEGEAVVIEEERPVLGASADEGQERHRPPGN